MLSSVHIVGNWAIDTPPEHGDIPAHIVARNESPRRHDRRNRSALFIVARLSTGQLGLVARPARAISRQWQYPDTLRAA